MSDGYLPVDQVLGGVELLPLGDGVTALDAIVLVKALGHDGKIGWFTRYTEGLTTIESLGALQAARVLEEDRVRALYVDLDSEGDE